MNLRGGCNPDEQAMLSLIFEKLSIVRNQELNKASIRVRQLL